VLSGRIHQNDHQMLPTLQSIGVDKRYKHQIDNLSFVEILSAELSYGSLKVAERSMDQFWVSRVCFVFFLALITIAPRAAFADAFPSRIATGDT